MAVALAALRGALQRIGLDLEARIFVTDDQQLNSLEELALLRDDDVKTLFQNMKRPGGMIPNPNAAVGGNIANPGIQVSLVAQRNFEMMCYWLRYKQRTSRVLDVTQITVANIRTMIGHKKWEANHTDATPPEINSKDWPKTINMLEEMLHGCLGKNSKNNLSYIIRDEVEVPEDDPDDGYATFQEEIRMRAPHVDEDDEPVPDYGEDNAQVFDIISGMTRKDVSSSWVKAAQKTRDGRMAFLALKNHYLGSNNVDTMSSQAEKILATTQYRGEQRRWNFERYVRTHVDQHAILEGLEEYGYSGIDPRSKVRKLLEGIKTPMLDVTKNMIMSSTDLRNDFDACVNLFQEFIKHKNINEIKDVTIAAVKTSFNKYDHKKVKNSEQNEADMSVQDRYYTKPEYQQLTQAQKLGLKLIREKRNGGQTNVPLVRGGGGGGGKKRTIKTVYFKNPVDDTGDESDDDEVVELKQPAAKKQKSNRNNKALSRRT